MLSDTKENVGIEFDESLIKDPYINKTAIETYAKTFKPSLNKEYKIASLLRAITCIDLTTLAGDDGFSNVYRLCMKANKPLREEFVKAVGLEKLQVGAVCVYPARVNDCDEVLDSVSSILPIAAVATGFPSGQYHLKTRIEEIKLAIDDGASEIDIVINRDLALSENWKELYYEIKEMKDVCGDSAHLKTILATGELASFDNIYKASMVCMMAGANFIKTSTGKESVNATLPVGIVMARAIYDYYEATGIRVGFKPAGGIRTANDVLTWQHLMHTELGPKWLFPSLFRIGASSLLSDVEKTLYETITGCPIPLDMVSYV